MRCPYCQDLSNRVIDSRLGRDGEEIRRRRECEECGRRFTTRERMEVVTPEVVKRNERREEFLRQKVLSSVQRACPKRPVAAEELELLVDRVERHVQEQGTREVSTRLVGDFVLAELVELDVLAAARFASVFQDFESAEDYEAFFDSIKRGPS